MRKEIEILKDQTDAHPDAIDEIVSRLGRRQRLRRRAVHLDVADPDEAFVERSSRFRQRSIVDLPQPDGPRMVVSWPSAMRKVARFRTDVAP